MKKWTIREFQSMFKLNSARNEFLLYNQTKGYAGDLAVYSTAEINNAADYLLVYDYGNRILYLPPDVDTSSFDSVKSYVINKLDGLLRAWAFKYKMLSQILDSDFNPIENYNMVEESTDTNVVNKNGTNSENSNVSKTGENKRTTSSLGSSSDTTTANNGSVETLHSVTSFDSDAMRPNNCDSTAARTDTVTGHTQNDNSVTDNLDTTDTEESSRSSEQTEQENATFTHRLTRKGNIGVTTSQQMLLSNVELSNINVAKELAKDFLNAFCISVIDCEI